MLCIADFKGYFIHINEAWEKTLGWSQEELTSVPFVDFVHPDDRDATAAEAKSVSDGMHTISFQNRYRCKNGTYKNILWKSSPDMKNGLIYGVARDITTLKQRESSLVEDNLRFQQILNAIEDFILLKDTDSRLIWANRGFRDFYGFRANEHIQGIIDKSDVDPKLTEKYMKDDRYVVDTKKKLVIPWEHSTRYDNAIRKLKVVKSPIFDDSGNVVMTLGVFKDITDDLEKEALIKEQQAKMINSARLFSLGEMAAGIAHEINNPLTIIDAIIFQTTTKIERNQFQLSELPAVFDRVGKSLHRIARIVRSLRFFSRNSENDPFTITPLSSIFQDTAELCREKFKLGEVDLRIEDPGNLKVLCRPSEIGQVLLNLVSNSFDAAQNKKNSWVKVQAVLKNSRIFISVTDSGLGIDHSIQDEMMSPFFTTKEVGQGTGLGLSIALGIVRAHGGDLIYDNQSGHTRFTFDIGSGES